MTEERKVFGPCHPRQRAVIQADEDCLLVGGGAGGGKSFLMLLKCLKWIQDPKAKIVIFRTQLSLIKLAGGLVSESKNIFPHFGGVYKTQAMEWHFPNGAMVKFAHMPNEDSMTMYLGLAATHICIDEAADDWTAAQIIFLLSRMRGAEYKGKMQLLMTCNPNNESFLYDWVKPLLDEETGIPKEGTDKVVRYFVNLNGKIHWGDTKEELTERLKHEADEIMPLSFRFIPMGIKQNPVLMKNNPSYYASLLAQNRIGQARYLFGKC